MSASARLVRLLALVPWLIAHEGVTIDEAAAHFQITPAELERDLWLLVVSGLPGHGPDQLVDIDFWDDGVITVIDPQTLDRPMRLTQEEIMTLLIALRMLVQTPGVVDRSALLSATAKLEAALDEAGSARHVPHLSLGVSEDVVASLDEAMASGRAVRITYVSGTRDDVTERTVLPLQTRVVDGVGYVEAWCSLAEAHRTFRLDRILTADAAPPVAAPASRHDDSPDHASSPAHMTAVLDLGPAARWIIDVHRGASLVEERPDGSALVSIPIRSLDWGVRLVTSLAGQGRAVSPPELVDAVLTSVTAARARYDDRVG